MSDLKPPALRPVDSERRITATRELKRVLYYYNNSRLPFEKWTGSPTLSCQSLFALIMKLQLILLWCHFIVEFDI